MDSCSAPMDVGEYLSSTPKKLCSRDLDRSEVGEVVCRGSNLDSVVEPFD